MYSIPFVMTTCNQYHHVLRVAIYLFNKNWDSSIPVEIVGYDKPDFELPSNFNFYSLGKQVGGAENFTTDLRPYFKKQPEWFLWMMDDSFVVGVDSDGIDRLISLCALEGCGKINLTRATRIQKHKVYEMSDGSKILEADQDSEYRLAMQPAIWNRDFLIKYFTPGLTPWKAETQSSKNDGWRIIGMDPHPVKSNEGTTKHNIYKLDLHGIPPEQIKEMEDQGILNSTMSYERVA